jgi:hypothetical protein
MVAKPRIKPLECGPAPTRRAPSSPAERKSAEEPWAGKERGQAAATGDAVPYRTAEFRLAVDDDVNILIAAVTLGSNKRPWSSQEVIAVGGCGTLHATDAGAAAVPAADIVGAAASIAAAARVEGCAARGD